MANVSMEKMVDRCDEVSRVLKVLSHPDRLKVLCFLMEEEKSVGDLTEFCGISQSAMSQFLIRMKNEGVLKSEREGVKTYYSIFDPNLKKLVRSLKDIYCK
jgi:hypothetical protein